MTIAITEYAETTPTFGRAQANGASQEVGALLEAWIWRGARATSRAGGRQAQESEQGKDESNKIKLHAGQIVEKVFLLKSLCGRILRMKKMKCCCGPYCVGGLRECLCGRGSLGYVDRKLHFHG